MARHFRYLENLRTIKKSGSLIFCDSCDKIIGSILVGSYKVLVLNVCCTCGTDGFLQFSPKIVFDRKASSHAPYYHNGIYTCRKCNTPLFSVMPERINNYAFYIECSCGEVYDTRVNHSKRLTETVRMFKQNKAVKNFNKFI